MSSVHTPAPCSNCPCFHRGVDAELVLQLWAMRIAPHTVDPEVLEAHSGGAVMGELGKTVKSIAKSVATSVADGQSVRDGGGGSMRDGGASEASFRRGNNRDVTFDRPDTATSMDDESRMEGFSEIMAASHMAPSHGNDDSTRDIEGRTALTYPSETKKEGTLERRAQAMREEAAGTRKKPVATTAAELVGQAAPANEEHSSEEEDEPKKEDLGTIGMHAWQKYEKTRRTRKEWTEEEKKQAERNRLTGEREKAARAARAVVKGVILSDLDSPRVNFVAEKGGITGAGADYLLREASGFAGRQISLATAKLWGQSIMAVAVTHTVAFAISDAGEIFGWGGVNKVCCCLHDHD